MLERRNIGLALKLTPLPRMQHIVRLWVAVNDNNLRSWYYEPGVRWWLTSFRSTRPLEAAVRLYADIDVIGWLFISC